MTPETRRAIARQLRKFGLITIAERGLFAVRYLRYMSENKKIEAQYPNMTFPPAFLAYDAYATNSHSLYLEGGIRDANIVFENLRPFLDSSKKIEILEWGCGPARIIRPLKNLLQEKGVNAHLTGTDYNKRTIDWCKKAIPEITFDLNFLSPPLPFQDNSFDAIYCVSVFTHLSEEQHKLWMNEVLRVLKPGGVFSFSVHGDIVKHVLSSEERLLYDAGKFVQRSKVYEGSRLYVAYQSPQWLRNNLLEGIEIVSTPSQSKSIVNQDVWIIRKALQ